MIVRAHDRKLPEHPVEHAVGRGPDPDGVLRIRLAQVAKTVQRRVPVATGLVDEQGVGLVADLPQETVAQ